MKKLITLLMTTLFASVTFAADVQPETPGSEAPKAAAEAKRAVKPRGIDKTAKQSVAQAPGDAKAQGTAETRHLKKTHGKVNDSADKRLEKDHPNH